MRRIISFSPSKFYFSSCQFDIGTDFITFDNMAAKPRTEMTPEELAKQEEQEFNTGPLSVLTQSVKNNTQVSFTGGS